MISIVACCHTAKLCALATQAFRLQPYHHAMVTISVSNSGQHFKTRVSGSWGKKPGKTQVLKWMRFWAIKTQDHC